MTIFNSSRRRRASADCAWMYRPLNRSVGKFFWVALTLHGKGDDASGDDFVYELRLTTVVKQFAGLGICVTKHCDRFWIEGVFLEELRTFTHNDLPLTLGKGDFERLGRPLWNAVLLAGV